jgi:hypothetical protein
MARRRRLPPRPSWSLAERARYGAVRDFELLKLLATDRKAFTTARRLDLFQSHPQPHPLAAAMSGADAAVAPGVAAAAAAAASSGSPSSASRRAARSVRPAAVAHPHPPPPAIAVGREAGAAVSSTRDRPVGDAPAPAANARRRRSAERSARRHCARQRPVRCCALAILFILRVRRRVRLRRDLHDLEVLSDGAFGVRLLRKRESRPPSSTSSSSASTSLSSEALPCGFYTAADPPVQHGRGGEKRLRQRGGIAGFLMR